ncbi:MAG: hypothetical protein J6S14_13455 [Clostridia bacterium]|nr:hypothetical protein [Clostridia bacterium]
MLTEICAYLRNYFCRDEDKHFGKFTISGGKVAPLDYLQDGQYFRIVGSVFNDGVYKYPAVGLTDEVFDGAVWAMRVPSAIVAVAEEIDAYVKGDEGKTSAYTSESFGGYSYTKATDANGAPLSWQSVFRSRLDYWRKI